MDDDLSFDTGWSECSSRKNFRTTYRTGLNHNFSGNVFIIQNDSILLEESYGYQEEVLRKENNSTTVFKIGSITKQFTSALILKLVEQGKLSLNDHLSSFFDNVSYNYPVTVRQLLQNTSGIPNYYFFPDYQKFKQEINSKEEMLNRILETKLRFVPGSEFEYSNSGYYLLGLVIERTSKMTYGEAIHKYITFPLGLTNTKFDDESPKQAIGYTLNQGIVKEADDIKLLVPFSAGGMISNTEDLNKWQESLFSNFLRQDLLKTMLTPGLDNYGLGFWITDSKLGKKIWHTGGIDGFRSMISYYPDRDLRVILLANREGYNVEGLESKIIDLIALEGN